MTRDSMSLRNSWFSANVCKKSFAPHGDVAVAKAVPRTSLVEHLECKPELEQFAQVRDAASEDQFKFAGAEWRCHLVFHHLHARHCTDVAAVFLDIAESAHIESERSVKLEGVSPCGHFWIAKGDVDFFAQLVDEEASGARFCQRSRDFAQCLTHEPRLQSEFVVAHLPFQFSFRGEGCHRVHHHEVNSSRADEGVGYFERLFSTVGLCHEEGFDVDA